MNEWISVKDKLPEEFVEVLVEVEGHRSPAWRNNHNLVAYMTLQRKNAPVFYEERHNNCDPLRVTHWMPLPPPPQQ